ncbi:hypothetical protein GIB67_009213 [Kingdonia uniflora]|uniref:Uncharacterized protein n=1 Tax=Kingdonia uniflora TaxID=39325 RepID=A0A7J7N2H6_9MAGN|nr:hypothetical protein GIB67_009213 [Kingdonia uniflora]
MNSTLFPLPQITQNPRNPNPPILTISSSLRGICRGNSRKPTKPSSDERVEFVIDIEDVANRASMSLRRFFRSSESKFNRFVSLGNEAFMDLKTLVRIDDDGRVIMACRRSSIGFLGGLVLWGFVVSVVVGAGVRYGYLGFRGLGFIGSLVRRRDRSLGGREVVVGKRRKSYDFRGPVNPLTPIRGTMARRRDESVLNRRKRISSREELPKWWRESVGGSTSSRVANKPEFQMVANRLIRAIMDNKMSGRDITEDHIIQFRQICRSSGVTVSIETTNARDSFYRTSVELVLNVCRSLTGHSTLGENAPEFIVGLADNIGLESIRAARIVTAVIAARTRSGFLQAWALEMQGKREEVVMELSKICLLHQIFPPQESSAEMEMVARGLEKHLRLEQRELLLNLLVGECGDNRRASAAEALGLVNRPLGIMDGL